jgi:hypothetical protein
MPPTQLSAFHPSPKRKRDNPPFVPHLNTTLRTASTPPRGSPTPSGADSPRNAVADQLRGMTITAIQSIPMSPLTPTDDVVRKKPKLEGMREHGHTSGEGFTAAEPASLEIKKQTDEDTVVVKSAQSEEVKEIPETPQPSQLPSRVQQKPRTFSDIVALPQPTIFTSSLSKSSTDEAISAKAISKPKNGLPRPRSRKKSPSPPLPSLTWQDNEITGHLVDPSTDPDDDGTGLNGIGFKPTPALAYVRAQKRRQQLLEWRARETKEARAKRSERRRRGVGGTGNLSREGTVERDTTAKEADASRRAVRFAI